MFCFKLSMNRLLKRIEQADEFEIDEIIRKLILWQKNRFPEYELVMMTLPRFDLEERSRQIDLMANMLKRYVETGGSEVMDRPIGVHMGSQ